ncbi:uncharacterized protein LOC128675577 [Plodia interpunctella]|uniref:uncharacterized protein LOC128675577 n=1 Tax=Plodia interpunctella TaxID=58824 RepID=UPI0023677A7A|nr:uncharacterized protein LOC128675577 [Plodia interpunctella]
MRDLKQLSIVSFTQMTIGNRKVILPCIFCDSPYLGWFIQYFITCVCSNGLCSCSARIDENSYITIRFKITYSYIKMSHLWVLVEWVDENNAFPTYGVVNLDPVVYNSNELSPGRVILLRMRHESTARRGRILTISDNKHHVKSHKQLLERQDGQMKSVLNMCMQTIKGMQPDSMYMSGGLGGLSLNSTHSIVNPRAATPQPPVVLATADSEDSQSDNEDIMAGRVINTYYNKPTPIPPLIRRMDVLKNGHSSMSMQHSERPMMSSTPLPPMREERPKLLFDQATQTDNTEAIFMEKKLKQMYSHFLALTARLELHKVADCNFIDRRIIAPLHAHTNENEIVKAVENMSIDQILKDLTPAIEVEVEGLVNQNVPREHQSVTVYTNEDKNPVSREVRVRRVSAQTTNNVEQMPIVSDMIPIGNGHAVVPARLLNEIDWNSYTSATRQLLQAIFPRRTLATHSLTGKQSPAFQDKPPKKCLDPKLVEDIVNTVSQKCGVDKRLVRNSITIKCTDEAKLYRNRQQYKLARSAANQNDENVPPIGTSSDESSVVAR